MMTVITTLVIIFQVSIIQFVKLRFIGVNITNLQQIVSVFELCRKQDGTAVYIYPTIVKMDSIAVFPTCMG